MDVNRISMLKNNEKNLINNFNLSSVFCAISSYPIN